MHEKFRPQESKEDVTPKAFLDAFIDIGSYNESQDRQHSFGTTLSNLNILKKEIPKSWEDQLADIEDDEGVTYESIKTLHEDNLNKVGLLLLVTESLKKDEDDEPRRLFVKIEHMTTFLEYTHSHFPAGKLNESLIEALKYLNENLNEEIEALSLDNGHYGKGTLVDRMIGVSNFTEEYRRMDPDSRDGLIPEVKKTETYVKLFENNTLYEHMIYKKNRLDQTVEEWKKTYGPAGWQKDSPKMIFEEKWNDVLAQLEELKGVPALFHSVRVKLEEAALFAKEDIVSNLKLKYPDDKNYDALIPIIDSAYHKLKVLEFE